MRALTRLGLLAFVVAVFALQRSPVQAHAPVAGATTLPSAIVLSGGGLVGGAWEAGVAKGLQDSGINLNAADLFVGTSAGAILATQIRAGQDIGTVYQAAISPPAGIARLLAPQSAADRQFLAQTTNLWTGPDAGQPGTAAEVGARALAANGIAQDTWIQLIGIALNVSAWPQQALTITAVDTADGSTRLLTEADGVSIDRAVAASVAIPAAVQPITIGNDRYMDGGVTGTHIDAASGHNVVAIIPYDAGSETAQEIANVQASGGQVLLIEPSTPLAGPFNFSTIPSAGAEGESDGSSMAGQVAAYLGLPFTSP
jgi:NTE family protein